MTKIDLRLQYMQATGIGLNTIERTIKQQVVTDGEGEEFEVETSEELLAYIEWLEEKAMS